MRDALKLVSSIEDLSRNGLTNRVEMPQEMLTRLTHIVKRRTHSQLKHLRENLAMDETAKDRQIPLDMYNRPLGWTLDKDEQIKSFLYGPSETMAYLAEDVEMTYACAHQAFRQLQQSRPDFAPQSVLDFGAGPGTASWVAKDYYDASVTRYRVLEPSQSMVDAAEVMLDGFPGLSIRRSVSEMKREIQKGLSYDLIVLNFVLSEITTDYERVAVMSALWELLSDKGVLVIVDRGSTWGSHQVRSARQFILDSVAQEDGEQEERAHVVAPCPHTFECPMTGKTWCHFVQRSPRVQYPRDATTKRWHGHKVSKFSYVVMEKSKAPTSEAAALPGQVGRLIRYALQPAALSVELLADCSFFCRGPLLANKHVMLDLCMPIVSVWEIGSWECVQY
jgi:ribosomal protein RSM22 (predicted rRNA methylase)